MKILTIAATPYFSDRGCHIRIFYEAKYLQKMGADVTLLTYHLGKDIGDFEIKRIGNVPGYQKTSPGFAWGKLWLDLKLLWLCFWELRQNRPDIIHAHLYEGLAVAYMAKYLSLKANIPIVFDLQGDLKGELEGYNKKNREVLKSFFVWMSKVFINFADFVVVSSENVSGSISNIYRKKRNIEIIRDGIDLDVFKEPKKPSEENARELERIEKWKREKKLLIYTGGMDDSKGISALISEIIRVRDEFAKDWKLLLYGSGNSREKYEKLIEEAVAQDFVCFAKETSFFALPNFLKLADVAVEPKENSTESSGKLMNYMAAELPVVCFENEFNRLRIGAKGSYIGNFQELVPVLNSKEFKRIQYDLKKESEENQVKKLFEIFKKLIKS
jgi:glycosyltransferase involved in cell wall biosynthesis